MTWSRYVLASVCGDALVAGALRFAALRGFGDFRADALGPFLLFAIFPAAPFRGPAIRKSSTSCAAFSAETSQRGLRPRPAHVSLGFSRLRYFGATGPYPVPSARTLPPELPKRESFPSSELCVKLGDDGMR